ncbi:Uncharacterised protein [Mycobacteroides abscessus subsp. abscessus]|nr:Uncharacterised protein [Mycobacteroides abscessus subsp. abscessus]
MLTDAATSSGTICENLTGLKFALVGLIELSNLLPSPVPDDRYT